MTTLGTKENPITINNWAIVGDQDPYLAPELRSMHLTGLIDEHHRKDWIHDPSKNIITSAVQKAEGRLVRTRNTWYFLGKASDSYLEYLEDNNIPYNEDSPIRIHRKEDEM